MAAASPHKKMVVLSLQQLEGATINLERDRVKLITAILFGPRTSGELPFEVLLREADQCCKEQGEILLYITRLTLTPGYYERPHRIQRVLYLLDSLMHCVDTVIDAAERLHAHKLNEEWPTNQKFFIMARRMLSTGRDMIKIQRASSNSEDSSNDVFLESLFTVSTDGMICQSEYLQKPAPYTWDSSGQNFLREISYSKADLLERAGTPEPYIERTTAVYSIVWTTCRPLCRGAEAFEGDDGHTNINSVWLSPMTDSILDKTDSSDYFRISRAVSNKYFNVPLYQLRGRPFEHPMILAQGLQDLNIEIGFIFADELSVVVWPLGKGQPTAKGCVVVHCTRTIDDGDQWLYKVLVLRSCVSEPEETRQLNMRDVRNSSEMTITRPPNATGSRKQEPPSVSGTSNEGKCFFDLPPELRNLVYRDCIERPCIRFDDESVGLCQEYPHDHFGEKRSQNLAELDPTALCRTSRRVRDEILPLLLASKVLTWLARSSNTAYLRSIVFRDTSSSRSRFGVWVQLTDICSGFKLATVEGAPWKPEETSGGSNLPALVRIIMLDKETVGLSMADVACIADFLGEKNRR
ncbi:hypothetical protein KC315_g8210 [Hortaea werneckii]|nr:hypothetical protein KC315_g8210 [Hortaea werneckii]KAI7345500.1 hypothetical protein KC354_g14716 [Hortaea werneckii]